MSLLHTHLLSHLSLRKGLAVYGAQAGLTLGILLPWSPSAEITACNPPQLTHTSNKTEREYQRKLHLCIFT